MKIIIATAAIFVALLMSCSTTEKLENRAIGLINNVSYTNTKFSNPNAGNGFLVRYKNKDYAITAKHVLMIAKTDQMKFVDFEGELKQWKLHPKNDSTSYVVLDKLLNTNKKDSLTWSYMDTHWNTYNDWLVFSVKENNSKNIPLKFRKKPLIKDEILYAVGWTYKDTLEKQRFYKYKFDKAEGNYYNLIQINGPKGLGGLSGAPVVDKTGKVVGLVSSGGENEQTKEIVLQATSIKNAMDFIIELD